MRESVKSTATGSIIYTAGQLLTKASGFFLIPLYTRFLSPADFGIIGYINVIIQIFTTILMFGQYGAQRRFYFDYVENKEKLRLFIGTLNLFLLIVVGGIVILFSFFGKYVFNRFKIQDIPFDPLLIYVAWISFFHIMR